MKDTTPKPVVFMSLHKNADPKAPLSQMYPANIVIPTTAWINDPVRGNVLIQYVKGERSIYAYTGGLDKNGTPFVEQTKDAKPKKELIIMSKGSYTCDPRETTLIEYLRKSFCEGSNLIEGGAIYKERDVVKTAEQELDKIYQDNDLINAVRSMDAIELACLSFVMGDKNAYNEDASTNKWNLTVAAKNTPEKLREKMDNPKTKRKAKIALAEHENILEIDRRGRVIKWVGGEKITTVPIGMDAIDYMVDMTFQPEYEEVYRAVCNKLNPAPKTEQVEETPMPVFAEKSGEEQFIENCLSTGVLVKKQGGWFSVKDAPKGDPYKNFAQGSIQTAIEHLRENPDLRAHLESLMGILV